MLVAGKPELREGLASGLREYFPTRRNVLADEEVSLFSDEITINCPWSKRGPDIATPPR
jgi:hypothetical protein